jgi:hypothetical protein
MRPIGLLVAAVIVLIAITAFAPAGVVAVAWGIAALLVIGAGLGSSPSVRLRGRVNRLDSGAGPPPSERDVKRP